MSFYTKTKPQSKSIQISINFNETPILHIRKNLALQDTLSRIKPRELLTRKTTDEVAQ